MTTASEHYPRPQALRDELAALIRTARSGLPPRASDEDVHSTRKRLKRARALARLLEPALGRPWRRQVDARLARAARALAGARDQAALLERFDALCQRAELGRSRKHKRQLRRELEAALAPAGRQARPPRWQATAVARAWLTDASRWLSSPAPNALAAEGASQGVQQTYHRARRGFKRAQGQPTTERLHAWRKQVKYHGFQLQALRSGQPLKQRIARLAWLGEALGEEHDLALLKPLLTRLAQSGRIANAASAAPASKAEGEGPIRTETAATTGAAKLAARLASQVKHRRKRIRRQALRRGRRLFSKASARANLN